MELTEQFDVTFEYSKTMFKGLATSISWLKSKNINKTTFTLRYHMPNIKLQNYCFYLSEGDLRYSKKLVLKELIQKYM